MIEVERKIYVVDEIFKNEIQYVYGEKRDTICYIEDCEFSERKQS